MEKRESDDVFFCYNHEKCMTRLDICRKKLFHPVHVDCYRCTMNINIGLKPEEKQQKEKHFIFQLNTNCVSIIVESSRRREREIIPGGLNVFNLTMNTAGTNFFSLQCLTRLLPLDFTHVMIAD